MALIQFVRSARCSLSHRAPPGSSSRLCCQPVHDSVLRRLRGHKQAVLELSAMPGTSNIAMLRLVCSNILWQTQALCHNVHSQNFPYLVW